jgi:hypothetical protein
MARKLNNRTKGLRTFVEMISAKLNSGDVEGTKLMLTDLWNDIGCAYVCIDRKPKLPGCPVPPYNPKKHGDYHAFLVSNNCD